MTNEEKRQWDNLYRFVQEEILGGYGGRPLSRDIVLRLKGLADGKYMSNKKTKSKGIYSYDVILMTFKAYKHEILSGMKRKESEFKDERHKMNYIMAIIDSNIANIYNRMKNAEKSKSNIDRVNIDVNADKADYKRKTKEIKNDRLKDMW